MSSKKQLNQEKNKYFSNKIVDKFDLTPYVKSISNGNKLPENFDFKNTFVEYIDLKSKKHL